MSDADQSRLQGVVKAVSLSASHRFSKSPQMSIRLKAGHGVEGDCHAGRTVKHRSRVRKDPTQPNLRQVHLLHQELLDWLQGEGHQINPGDIGENILTTGIDLLTLPTDARLSFPSGAIIRITGLRNPCIQLNRFSPGLMDALITRAPDGSLIRKGGIMAVVEQGGDILPGDAIEVTLPDGQLRRLEPV
ncbi:MAG: MOSC domain-containing protein [Alphaproteobacteria bacterium]